MGGGDFEKIVRTGLCNEKNPGRITRRKKSMGPAKGRKERLKEQEN